MADISIDSTISTSTARGCRSLVFTTASIGYCFFIDSGTTGFKYRKTTDGGATWAAAVLISPAVAGIAFDVWFDQWTPGDSGTKIHTVAFEATNDDAVYRSLDTASDTLGTATNVFVGASAVAGRGAFCSIAKMKDGKLYVAYDLDAGAERGFHRSTDGGANWSANLSTTFVEATIDECLLFPASNTGDNADCLALYHDASADALTLKLWDSSGASATESATIITLVENTTDLVGQRGFSASVRHSDGHLICAAISELDTATSDHRVFDLNCTAPSTFSITEKTAITTNIDDHYHPNVFIDQTTDKIFVAFNGLRTGLEDYNNLSKVYYTSSTDGGTNWSAGSTAYMEGSTAAVLQVYAPLMGPRFYVAWRVAGDLQANAVNSVTFATAYSLAIAAGSYAASGVAASVLLGHVLAAAAGSYAATGTNAGTFKGSTVAVAAGAYAVTGSDATLTYTPNSNHLLVIDPGSYAVSGSAVSALLGRKLAVDTAAYTSTGTTAALLLGRKVAVDGGSYAETGATAGVFAGRAVSTSAGAYTATGQDASLIYTPANNHIIAAVGGSYTLAGTTVAVLKGSDLVIGAGAYTSTGVDANLFAGSVPHAIARFLGTTPIRSVVT